LSFIRWFAFPGDGAPIDKWKHWFSKDPILNDLTVEMYPSVDEYDDEDLMASTIKMRDGSYAKFYSAARANVVKKVSSNHGITPFQPDVL
jgi:hypothetical protein